MSQDMSPKSLQASHYSSEELGVHKDFKLPVVKTRLSSNETIPYSEYIVGTQSSITKEAPLLNHRTSDSYYKPQKRYNYGRAEYTINLKQPRFTYLPLNQTRKIDVIPQRISSKDLHYSSKMGAYILKFDNNKTEEKDNLNIFYNSARRSSSQTGTPKQKIVLKTPAQIRIENEPKEKSLHQKYQQQNMRRSVDDLYSRQIENVSPNLKKGKYQFKCSNYIEFYSFRYYR